MSFLFFVEPRSFLTMMAELEKCDIRVDSLRLWQLMIGLCQLRSGSLLTFYSS